MSEASREDLRKKALDFTNEVREVLGPGYNQFVAVLNDFTTQRIDAPSVVHQICQLLADHPHLAQGFNYFLPAGVKMPSPEEFKDLQERDMLETAVPAKEEPLPTPDHPPDTSSFPRQSFVNESELPPTERDLFAEATKFVIAVKERFTYDAPKLQQFYQIIRDFVAQTRSLHDLDTEVLSLFSESATDLLPAWVQFLPPSFRAEAKSKLHLDSVVATDHLVEAIALDEAPEPEVLPKKDRRVKKEQKSVEFTQYQPVLPLETDHLNLKHDEHSVLSSAKRALANSPILWACFLRSLDLYAAGVFEASDVELVWGEIFKDHTYVVDSLVALIRNDKETLHNTAALLVATPGFKEKLRKVTPSYRVLPPDYVHPKCSGRGDLEKEVLNDVVVSAPAGSESGGVLLKESTAMTVFYNTLLKNEDDMTEMNMMINLTMALIRKMEVMSRLSEVLVQNCESTESIKITERLPSIYQYILRREFGARAGEIEEAIYDHPDVVIPVVLNRLKLKHQELLSIKKELLPVWSSTIQLSYEKALETELSLVRERDSEACKPQKINQDVQQEHFNLQVLLNELTSEGVPVPESEPRKVLDSLGFGEFPMNHLSIIREPLVVFQGVSLLSALSACLQESSSEVTDFLFKFIGNDFFGYGIKEVDIQRLLDSEMIDELNLSNSHQKYPYLNIYLRNKKEFNPVENPTEEVKPPGSDDDEPINVLYCDVSIYVLFRLLLLFFERLSLAFTLCKRKELITNCKKMVTSTGQKVNSSPLTNDLGASSFVSFIKSLIKFSSSSSLQTEYDTFLSEFFGPLSFHPLSILPVLARRVVVQVIIIITRSPLSPQLIELHRFVSNRLIVHHPEAAGYIQNPNYYQDLEHSYGKPQLLAPPVRDFSSEYRHHAMALLGSKKMLFEVRIAHFPLRLSISVLGQLFAAPSPKLPFIGSQTVCDYSLIGTLKYLGDPVHCKVLKDNCIVVGNGVFQRNVPSRTHRHSKRSKIKNFELKSNIKPFIRRNLRKLDKLHFMKNSLEVKIDVGCRQFVYVPGTFDFLCCKHLSEKI
ncbi:hypothetical protein P9112_012488 [Eukaryota sp. TZLM1-RC]